MILNKKILLIFLSAMSCMLLVFYYNHTAMTRQNTCKNVEITENIQKFVIITRGGYNNYIRAAFSKNIDCAVTFEVDDQNADVTHSFFSNKCIASGRGILTAQAMLVKVVGIDDDNHTIILRTIKILPTVPAAKRVWVDEISRRIGEPTTGVCYI